MENTEHAFTTQVGKDWLLGLLKEGEIALSFTKKDGSDRTMRCTLQDKYIIPYEKKTNRVKTQSNETLSVWDLDKNEWRSFRYDSVKRVYFTLGNDQLDIQSEE
jgi:hypothetical protein